MNDSRKLAGYEEETDDRTAIVNLKELKAPRKQSKDRHLLVRVRGAELGRVTLLSPERMRVGRSQDSELWLADDGRVVGVNNNTDFYRGVTEGRLTSTARPIHRGRSQQVWAVETTDAEGRLVARGQVRLQNLRP